MVNGRIELPAPFSLGLTLLCGQAFGWEGPDAEGAFHGAAGGASWRLGQPKTKILTFSCSSPFPGGTTPETFLSDYLRLRDPLRGLEKEFNGDRKASPVLGEALRTLRGLRLLRQDPFECAVSYLYAQGLSVPVISGALAKFRRAFGRPLPPLFPGAPALWDFPRPDFLSSLTPGQIRPYANNYLARARRIQELSNLVDSGQLDLGALRGVSTAEARASLLRLDGVGPKIADCILLFSLDHLDAFPLDRWVVRALGRHFGFAALKAKSAPPAGKRYEKIALSAYKRFGPRCGLASEYLFLYLRIQEERTLRECLEPFLGK